jgi:hypothetical protein
MRSNSSRHQENLDRCLGNASSARTPELKELWQTMADSYRHLLDFEKCKVSHQSWLRNNIPLSTK